MATLKAELKKILDKYGIDPRDKSQVWDCHGTLVLYHRAYEVIAAKEGIVFDMPMVLEADGINKTVALCVLGHMGDYKEWSVGEAAPGNNKNSYPYAMAEKRAKDRVVGKLVGLSEYIYSEAEADEFAQARGKELPAQTEAREAQTGDWETLANDIIAEAKLAPTVLQVNRLLAEHKADVARMKEGAPQIFATMKKAIEDYRSNLPV